MAGPPSPQARLPSVPVAAPLNIVRFAMEQHDVIEEVW